MSMHIIGLLSEAKIGPSELKNIIKTHGEAGTYDILINNYDWEPRFGEDDAICLDTFDRMRLYEVTLPDGNKGIFHIHWMENDEPHAYIIDHPDYQTEDGLQFLGIKRKENAIRFSYTNKEVLTRLTKQPDKTAGYCITTFHEDPKSGKTWYTSNYGFGTNVREITKGNIADFLQNRNHSDAVWKYFTNTYRNLMEKGFKFHHIQFRCLLLVDPETGLPL